MVGTSTYSSRYGVAIWISFLHSINGIDKSTEGLEDTIDRLYKYENERDFEHLLVLYFIRQGDFQTASTLFNILNEVYRPTNKLEEIYFARDRYCAIDRVLMKTKTVNNLLVIGENVS